MSNTIDPGLFRETLGHYPTGVAVVTCVAEDGVPDGMVVGTFSSVSLEPPLVAFFPAKSSGSFARLRKAQTFCINVLASDQEALCRRIATVTEGKFDDVRWRPGPLGSPILHDVVSWIECEFEEIREAGDHYVVLGRVNDLGVERSTLPLLFFQGGYGRFSPRSLIAKPDPELIQAAHLAETIRSQVEDLSHDLSVNCSVLANIHGDAVQVLSASGAAEPESSPLGHRQPIIPPLGAIFMASSSPAEVDDWLQLAPRDTEDRQEQYRSLIAKVRERGYSVLATDPELLQRHQEALSEYEQTDRLPRHERAVQQVISELVSLFCPDLVPGELYDLYSVHVLVPPMAGLPPMALRMTGLPKSATVKQIEAWVDCLKNIAAAAASNRATSDATR